MIWSVTYCINRLVGLQNPEDRDLKTVMEIFAPLVSHISGVIFLAAQVTMIFNVTAHLIALAYVEYV